MAQTGELGEDYDTEDDDSGDGVNEEIEPRTKGDPRARQSVSENESDSDSDSLSSSSSSSSSSDSDYGSGSSAKRRRRSTSAVATMKRPTKLSCCEYGSWNIEPGKQLGTKNKDVFFDNYKMVPPRGKKGSAFVLAPGNLVAVWMNAAPLVIEAMVQRTGAKRHSFFCRRAETGIRELKFVHPNFRAQDSRTPILRYGVDDIVKVFSKSEPGHSTKQYLEGISPPKAPQKSYKRLPSTSTPAEKITPPAPKRSNISISSRRSHDSAPSSSTTSTHSHATTSTHSSTSTSAAAPPPPPPTTTTTTTTSSSSHHIHSSSLDTALVPGSKMSLVAGSADNSASSMPSHEVSSHRRSNQSLARYLVDSAQRNERLLAQMIEGQQQEKTLLLTLITEMKDSRVQLQQTNIEMLQTNRELQKSNLEMQQSNREMQQANRELQRRLFERQDERPPPKNSKT
ncbi:hypothetical protein Pelo_12011 [Pelomyxa schiedti]|nr:hypothetical protein Pelo_12011 [Pelomyxa schiedti]